MRLMKNIILICLMILLSVSLLNCSKKSAEISNDEIPSPPVFGAGMPEINAEVIYAHPPIYPSDEFKEGIEGQVFVTTHIDSTGNILETKVAKSSNNINFDKAALEAAYKYKFSPPIRNGQPISIWVSFYIEFKIEDEIKNE